MTGVELAAVEAGLTEVCAESVVSRSRRDLGHLSVWETREQHVEWQISHPLPVLLVLSTGQPWWELNHLWV